MNIEIGKSQALVDAAQGIRQQVFVYEQGIAPALDLDGLDAIAHHVLVTDHNQAVATARLVIDDNGHGVIARVAVVPSYRGKGVAKQMMAALLAHARQLAAVSVELHAHQYLKDYYQAFGFRYVRDVEVVGGHQLIEMQMTFGS